MSNSSSQLNTNNASSRRRPSITTSRSSPDLRAHVRGSNDSSGLLNSPAPPAPLHSPTIIRPAAVNATARSPISSFFSLGRSNSSHKQTPSHHVDRQAASGLGPSSPTSSDDDDEDNDSNGSSSHLPFPSQTTFAPPFYNRPPTPLPPSPSLTSLLRPPSLSLSRPTTPDSSDSESVATSSRIAQATPRASPRVPTYEYYGFVLYLISTLAFGIYIVWSYAPATLLHTWGIHYYPSRWWSLALPSWLVIAIVYVYIALGAYNTGHLTRGLQEVEVMVDQVAKIATVQVGVYPPRESKREWKKLWNRGTDGVMDVPLGGVCEVLYGEGREREDWEMEEEAVGEEVVEENG